MDYFSNSSKTDIQGNYKLTPREKEILQSLLSGDSYKMLANACNITIESVYSHINKIYKKLQDSSNPEDVIKEYKERIE